MTCRFVVLFVFFRDEVQGDGIHGGLHLGAFDTGGLEHPLGSDGGGRVGVLVGQIHHFGNAALDNGLGAFVAGEQSHEQAAAL